MKKCFILVILAFMTSCTGFNNIQKINFFLPLQNQAQEYTSTLPKNHIPLPINERVAHYLRIYTKSHRRYLPTVMGRAYKYLPMMKKAFKEKGLPEELIFLPIIESAFKMSAYSHAHASGPWQFMKGTGSHYGLRSNWWVDERRCPEKSTMAAVSHLHDLYKWLKDWNLALGAYNAGGGKISRAIKRYKTRDFWKMTSGNRTYLKKETRNYVPKFLATVIACDNLKTFSFTNITKEKSILFDTVKIPDATDLKLIAGLCNTSYDEIKKLNPELKQWATPPKYEDYQLRIPFGRRDEFISNYSNIPQTNRITYRRHKIKSGESVWTIAKKYNIPREMIMDMNKLSKKAFIREGKYLIIPIRGLDKAKEIDKLFSKKTS